MLKALTLLPLVALLSCSSKPTSNDDTAEPTIVGMWRWKATIHDGWIRDTTTPATCGCTRGIRFTAAGNYERFTNDTVAARGTYTLHRGNPNIPSDPDTSLWVKLDSRAVVANLTLTGLDLDESPWDGPLERYIR